MKAATNRFLVVIILFFMAIQCNVSAREADSLSYLRGRSMFQTYCSACHGVHREIVGPMLASITKKRSEEWLISFIKNSQEVILSGDEYSIYLYEQYNRSLMPSFHQLSYNEIHDIINFIEQESWNSPRGGRSDEQIILQGRQDMLKGKRIFHAQCSPCHFIHRESDYGPALGSVSKRKPKKWLISFIRNSQEVIQSGDPYAVALFNNYDQRIMVPMEFLTEEEIEDVLTYIDYASSMKETDGIRIPNETSKPKIYYADSAWPNYEWTFFKVSFVLVGLAGVYVHALLVIKLFRYLNKG